MTTRPYRITVDLEVEVDADLADPFLRNAVFRALVDALKRKPITFETTHGPATATVGLVTGSA